MLRVTYASPKLTHRAVLWSELGETQILSPWFVVGDFNVVLSSEERSLVGRPSTCFHEWVHKRELIDLVFNGPRFTWSHSNDVW